MSATRSADPTGFDCVLDIAAPPEAVFGAFFHAERLRHWWGVRTAITVPRPLGIYALEWEPTGDTDPLLGRLDGTFYGIVIDLRPGRELFLADGYWLPADGDPIGPMAVQVTCDATATGTRLRFQQGGCDDSPRWQRFYRVINERWRAALLRLKADLESI